MPIAFDLSIPWIIYCCRYVVRFLKFCLSTLEKYILMDVYENKNECKSSVFGIKENRGIHVLNLEVSIG